MMKIAVVQNFNNHSEKAIAQVIATCPGKPLLGNDGKTTVGTITHGERIYDKAVRFHVELETV